MPNDKKEKIKLYMVIGLACVAVSVAYFRFFHPKDEPTMAISEAPEKLATYPIQPSNIISQRINMKSTQEVQPTQVDGNGEGSKKVMTYPIHQGNQPSRGTKKEFTQEVQTILVGSIRDIFERPHIPVEPEPPVSAGVSGVTAPKVVAPEDIPLELKGTIIGGNNPMAIINEKFVRLGEKIDIFRVTRIDANEVVLKAGSHQRVLKVLKPEDHLGQ